jgi:hypothetical protein
MMSGGGVTGGAGAPLGSGASGAAGLTDNEEEVQQPTQYAGAVCVPWPYEVWQDGVWVRGPKASPSPTPATMTEPLPGALRKGRQRLTPTPLIPLQRGTLVDGDEHFLQVAYRKPDGVTATAWLTRSELTNHNELQLLGAAGLPITSLNTKGVLLYLQACETENPQLAATPIGARSAWYAQTDGSLGFLLGTQWHGPGNLSANPRGNLTYLRAFTQKGDRQTWYDAWRHMRQDSWVRRFLLGATFAPLLLRPLWGRTFILHHWGQSGNAKTAIARFALSAWGDPERLAGSMNRTVISMTEIFRYFTDLPSLMDEKQASTVPSDQLIMHICMKHGRDRGDKAGGLQKDRQSWLTIMRTTGEVPLIGADDVGGQHNRVMQISSAAFHDRREAEKLYPLADQNYGFAGPEFLQHLIPLLNTPGGPEHLTGLYHAMRAELSRRNGTSTNHSGYAAMIALGSALAEHWLLGIDWTVAMAQAIDDAELALIETAPASTPSYAEKGLSVLRDYWVSNPGAFIDDENVKDRENAARFSRMSGVAAGWAMVFVPSAADAILVAARLEPARIWRDFEANGWLIVTQEGHRTAADLGGGRSKDHPVYAIKPEIFYSGRLVEQNRGRLRLLQGGKEVAAS